MSIPGDKFREYLNARGRGMTREHEAVLSEALSSKHSFKTDQIVGRVNQECHVTRATVYRTLFDMVSAGLLWNIHNDNRDAFERVDTGS